MKINKLLLPMWMGFAVMVLVVVGCSSSTDASASAQPAEDGQYKMVMAGSSGYGKMTVDSVNVSNSMLEVHFDTNQDGTYDINIMTNGIDLKAGFKHTDGTTVKLADGNKLEMTVPGHGTILTAVDGFEGTGSNLEIYTGMSGERESIFSKTNTIDKSASDSIASRIELSKVIFNIILNKDNGKFKFINKGIEVNFFSEPGLTEAEKTKIRDEIGAHKDEVAVGSYKVEGDNYTFTLGGKEITLKKVGDNLVKSEFKGMLCDNNYILYTDSDIYFGNPTNGGKQQKHKVAGCVGIQGAYIDGYKAKKGEYYLADRGETTPAPPDAFDRKFPPVEAGASTNTIRPRAIEVYTTLKKHQ